MASTGRSLGRAVIVIVAATGVLAASVRPACAQIQAIVSGGFSAAYQELLPQFEQAAGITVSTTSGGSIGNGPNTIGNQIRRGVPADVIILAREGLRELVAEGRTVPGSDVDLAHSVIGVVVPAGAPKPIGAADAARPLIAFLASSISAPAITKSGMEPRHK